MGQSNNAFSCRNYSSSHRSQQQGRSAQSIVQIEGEREGKLLLYKYNMAVLLTLKLVKMSICHRHESLLYNDALMCMFACVCVCVLMFKPCMLCIKYTLLHKYVCMYLRVYLMTSIDLIFNKIKTSFGLCAFLWCLTRIIALYGVCAWRKKTFKVAHTIFQDFNTFLMTCCFLLSPNGIMQFHNNTLNFS